jgi:hypothetical protein
LGRSLDTVTSLFLCRCGSRVINTFTHDLLKRHRFLAAGILWRRPACSGSGYRRPVWSEFYEHRLMIDGCFTKVTYCCPVSVLLWLRWQVCRHLRFPDIFHLLRGQIVKTTRWNSSDTSASIIDIILKCYPPPPPIKKSLGSERIPWPPDLEVGEQAPPLGDATGKFKRSYEKIKGVNYFNAINLRLIFLIAINFFNALMR